MNCDIILEGCRGYCLGGRGQKLPPMSKLSVLFYSHMGYIAYCFNGLFFPSITLKLNIIIGALISHCLQRFTKYMLVFWGRMQYLNIGS